MSARLAYARPLAARPAVRTAPQVEGRERTYRGSFAQVRALLPDFERVSFVLGPGGIANRTLDTIVRRADFVQGLPAVPVGVVSRRYAMVTHHDVLDAMFEAVARAGLDPAETVVEAAIGEHGARMALSVILPPELALDPGDGHALSLRLFCVNFVDRSSRLRIALGWSRSICGSGLMVGKTCTEIGECHREGLTLEAVRELLVQGLWQAGREGAVVRTWAATAVGEETLVDFVDGPLARAWGSTAAARLWHIAHTGRDASFALPFEAVLPHRRTMEPLDVVPGSPVLARTAYDVSQALAWVAKSPRDPARHLQRMLDIPDLMGALLRGCAQASCVGSPAEKRLP